MLTTVAGVTERIELQHEGTLSSATAPDLYVNGALSAAAVTIDTGTAGKVVLTHSTAGRVAGDILDYRDGSATIDGTAYPIVVAPRRVIAEGDTAGTTTLLSRLTAARAANLDNLDAAVSTCSTFDVANDEVQIGVLSTVNRELIAGEVWAWDGRTLDSFGTLDQDVAAVVWTAATRSLTDKANFTLTAGERSSIGTAVWASTTRTLTSFGTLAADAAAAVWGAASRTLTAVADSSGVTTLLGLITPARAANLDNLNAAVSTRSTFDGDLSSITGAITNLQSHGDGAWATADVTGLLDAATFNASDASTMATRWLGMTELDGAVYRYTVNTLEQAPAGGGGGTGATAQQVVDALMAETIVTDAGTLTYRAAIALLGGDPAAMRQGVADAVATTIFGGGAFAGDNFRVFFGNGGAVSTALVGDSAIADLGNLPADVAAIKERTDNLPDVPVSGGDVNLPAIVGGVLSGLAGTTNPIIVAPYNGHAMTLYQGDDYSGASGITIVKAASDATLWPSTIATVDFTARPRDELLNAYPAAAPIEQVAATVVNAIGDSQAVRVDLTAAQLNTLQAWTRAGYDFWVVANRATAPKTLRSGVLKLLPGSETGV